MDKRWTFLSVPPEDMTLILSRDLNNLSLPLTRILIRRGIDSFDKAKKFFRPNLENDLHDPFLMADMPAAVERLQTAISEKETIMIYGDYDVDGTTAVSIVYLFLSLHTDKLIRYVPDRYKEGYGISDQGIDVAAEKGCKLIIALDCGIKSIDKVEYAKDKGIDMIICDHHTPGDSLPDAVAVLDPKREDCKYPYKELSGAGVGFKLLQAYCQQHNVPVEPLFETLDLLAVSIGADIVPINDENRVLAHYGLKKLNSTPQPGLRAIIEIAKAKKEITMTDIGYVIGPRINAAGRINTGMKAVELLCADCPDFALIPGEDVDLDNQTRKELDRKITEEAITQILNNPEFKDHKSTVVYAPKWNKGVIGIVASRLVEKFYRPTVVFTKSNGVWAGSARSVKGFDLYQALEQCQESLIQFGGHKFAAGMTIQEENIPSFIQQFETTVQNQILPQQEIPEVEIDDCLSLTDITPRFWQILKQFEPFGPANPTPVFMVEDLVDTGQCRVVGEEHLKLQLAHLHSPQHSFPAIAFKMGHLSPRISQGEKFKACFSIEENHWKGQTTLQLTVKDIRFYD